MTAPDLTPAERATVDRIKQAPDALGLREEVAEAAIAALRSSRLIWGTHADQWTNKAWQREFWTEAGETVADAILPRIERREAEVAERALRDAVDEVDRLAAGLPNGWRPLDPSVAQWLRDRADRIGGSS